MKNPNAKIKALKSTSFKARIDLYLIFFGTNLQFWRFSKGPPEILVH